VATRSATASAGPRRDAGEKPLLGGEATRGLDGRLVFDGVYLVQRFGPQDLGDEPGADPLNGVAARVLAGEHGRLGRFDGDRPDVGFQFLRQEL